MLIKSVVLVAVVAGVLGVSPGTVRAQTPRFACATLPPPLGATPQPQTHLFLTSPGGSVREQITSPVGDAAPAWFPDFRRLAFASLRAGSGTWELYSVGRDGADVRALTWGSAADQRLPAPSPDGLRVAYGCGGDVCVVGADGAGPPRVVVPNAGQARWSPDGEQVIYAAPVGGHPAVHIADASGAGLPRQVTWPTPGFPDANAPAWSPRGDLIAFWSGVTGGLGQIFVAAPDGSGRRPLSRCDGACTTDQPSFSPDGSALLAGRGHADGTTDTRVFDPYGPDGQVGGVVLPFLCVDGRQPWGY